uniref:Protein kinase domain-containing protein n=1 Tax=Parascaris univalens TaxID=6257 RepID=A0A915B516_PARUN
RNNSRVLSRQRRIFKSISGCPSEGIVKECAYIRRVHHQSDIHRWYDIGEVIGHGNFSHVFSAVGRRDQSKLAIKQINKRLLRGQLYFVENEVNILKSCGHKNICQLRDAFESSSAYILVFE